MTNGIRLWCELPWNEEGIESNHLYIILVIHIVNFVSRVQIYLDHRTNMIYLCSFFSSSNVLLSLNIS